MALKAGGLPSDSNNRPSDAGYAPGTGVIAMQLGTPSADTSPGGNGQLSAPVVVTLASNSAEAVNAGTPTESAVSVGAENTPILNANANRKFLLLINDSSNIIYVSIAGNPAALNTGQRLNANGGSILFDRYVPTTAIKAIATSASSNLLVSEG